MKIILLLLVILGTYLITFKKWPGQAMIKNDESRFVQEVKKQFSNTTKPSKIYFKNYVKSPDHPYQNEIAKMKKMKIPQDPQSAFYVEIELFTDEGDPKAPLVVQLRYLDSKTNNLIKELSLNLN